jgi:hypothetical protein
VRFARDKIVCVWVELYVTKLYVTKWSDKVVRERLCATKLCVKGFCMRKLRRRVVCDQVVCDKEERDKVVCVKDYVWQEGRGGGGSRRRDTEPKTRTPHKDVRSVRQFQRKFLTGYASYSNGAGRAPERLHSGRSYARGKRRSLRQIEFPPRGCQSILFDARLLVTKGSGQCQEAAIRNS